MRAYLARRVMLGVVTVFGVTVVIFVAMRVLPGDPLAILAGEGQAVRLLTKEELAAAKASLGLDKPLVLQYFAWMKDVAKGDLGRSFWREEPIRVLVMRRGPITAQIAVMAVVISWLVGLPVGIIAALWRNSPVDYLVRSVATLFLAVPGFWLGLIIMLLTVLFLQWRPPLVGVHAWDDPWRSLQITGPPALVLGANMGAFLARMSRATLLEVLGEDYVRTARAKGLGERLVVSRHALRNSLIPVITVSGIQMGFLLGGSVAVEQAFSAPGLGTALVQAIDQRDWMVIQNLALLCGLIFFFVNLAVDLSYGWLDPRVRYE